MSKTEAHVKIFGRKMPLPKTVSGRRVLGIALIIGGVLGFLPILGFWMLPLGAFILSFDSPWFRRLRRRFELWSTRRWRASRFSRQKAKANKTKKKSVSRTVSLDV